MILKKESEGNVRKMIFCKLFFPINKKTIYTFAQS